MVMFFDPGLNCSDFLLQRAWRFGVKTLDCIEGQSFYDNAVYNQEFLQVFVVACACTIVNIHFIYNLFTGIIHPKFRLRTERSLCIYLHIFSALLELVATLVAWFLPGEYNYYAVMVIVGASFTHIVTALYQIPIVFGVQALMIPGYLFVAACKLLGALNLLYFPSCYFRIIISYNILSIYPWTREFIALFNYFGIFHGSRYAVALLISTAVVLPGLGPAMILYSVLLTTVFVSFMRFCFSNDKYALLFTENSGDPFSNSAFERVFFTALEAPVDEDKSSVDSMQFEKKMLRKLFHDMDTDGDGKISQLDAKEYALKVKEPQIYHKLNEFFENQEKSLSNQNTILKIDWIAFLGLFTGQGLLMYNRKIPNLKERSLEAFKNNDLEQQARIIFEIIDRNASDQITLSELGIVLLEFGLPPSEVRYLFLRYDKDNSGFLEFDEFKKYFKPLWKYAFKEFILKMKRSERVARRLQRMKDIEREIFEKETEGFKEWRRSLRAPLGIENSKGKTDAEIRLSEMEMAAKQEEAEESSMKQKEE